MQVILKQTIFFPFITCLAELAFSEKNTLLSHDHLKKNCCSDIKEIIYSFIVGKFNHK